LPGEKQGKVLIYNLNKTFPLFFTGRQLRPPGIEIEATAQQHVTMHGSQLSARIHDQINDPTLATAG